MSADCALNIIQTGGYVDNTEWPQKSIYSISSSCDNRTPSNWFVNETDEATQVTMTAPIAADARQDKTINESGDFTKEQNKICIHDFNENANGHLSSTNECEDTENTSKIWRRELNNIKKCIKNERYKTNHLLSLVQEDNRNKDLTRQELEQFDANMQQNIYNDKDYNKMSKKTRKKSSDSFEDYSHHFVRKNKEKTLQTIPYNVSDKMEEKINRNIYKHIPHKNRPPLIVARRNARERRRVQAVNSAFMRLRNIVPLGNNRYLQK